MLDSFRYMLDHIQDIVILIIRSGIIICDMIGVLVLVSTVVKSVYHHFHRDRHVKLMLAQGIALALEFKLAAEVLRTVMVREWSELVVLGTIIALRGAITVLIYWEIKKERAYEREEDELLARAGAENITSGAQSAAPQRSEEA